MTDGVFKRNGSFANARAAEIMSTESETDFEWSVKLIGELYFRVGIRDYDNNVILYDSNNGSPVINGYCKAESDIIHQNLPEQKTGDIIQLRFQPQRKKLIIYLVRIRTFLSAHGVV